MGFQATNAGGQGLIPGQGTKIPLAATKSLHDAINIQKKKKKGNMNIQCLRLLQGLNEIRHKKHLAQGQPSDTPITV